MKTEKIAKILNEWWQDENTCSGEKCSIKDCDLCINCFMNLCDRLGCKWNANNKGDVISVK